MIKRIISGGEIGGEIAGLIVAKQFGLNTSGYMSKGFLTFNGSRKDIADEYGLIEHDSYRAISKIHKNIEISDGTLKFVSGNDHSSEEFDEYCMSGLKLYKKPFIEVSICVPGKPPISYVEVEKWINRFNIQTLNINGGYSLSKQGIVNEACNYLSVLFQELKIKP